MASDKHSYQRHGLRHTRLYGIWAGMKSRCSLPTSHDYPYYGGRGIKVCAEWLDDFLAFHSWALNSGYADNLTIDRIDSDGDYTPENCRWLSREAQQDNRRTGQLLTAFGETKSAAAWAKDARCAV